MPGIVLKGSNAPSLILTKGKVNMTVSVFHIKKRRLTVVKNMSN